MLTWMAIWGATMSLGAAPPMCVVGYLPEYRVKSYTWHNADALTDLIVFSLEPTNTGELTTRDFSDETFAKVVKWKKQTNGRALFCVGGWGRSDNFATVAKTLENRKRFAENVLRFCVARSLDGVDIDWEHPRNQREQEDYAELLAELKSTLAPTGRLVTLAMAGWQQLPKRAFESLDRIHLMAYDGSGQHSTFVMAQNDVEQLLRLGARPSQICLGLPFYGRGVEKRDRTLTYAQIVESNPNLPSNADEVDGVYFNGPELIDRKVGLAREKQLAGVMVWEIGQDALGNKSLLRRIGAGLSSSTTTREK